MRKRRITEEQIKQLIEQFVVGISARSVAYVCGIHRNTARKWYHQFRILISKRLAKEHKYLPALPVLSDASQVERHKTTS